MTSTQVTYVAVPDIDPFLKHFRIASFQPKFQVPSEILRILTSSWMKTALKGSDLSVVIPMKKGLGKLKSKLYESFAVEQMCLKY